MNHLFNYCNRRGLVLLISLLMSGSICLSQAAFGQEDSDYKNFEQFESALKSLVKAHSGLAAMESIGKTNSGREIWLLTIAKKSGTPVDQRPGLLVNANLEGDHLIGSEIALGSMKYLLSNYESDESIKKALDEHVFYFLPKINPDGAEKNFGGLSSGVKTNDTNYDGDNDGRMDEDGPDDLNGDGIITVMRVKDPNGLYMIDPDNPGLMKKSDPMKGEAGEYSVYWEGIDNDADGFINEDPTGGVDINRNFMHKYPYFKEDAGIHMASEKETRAVIDWIVKQRNVAIMLTFGESDNLISPPNSRGELSSDKGISMFDFADASFAGASKVGMVSTGRGYGMGRFMGMQFFRGSRSSTPEASSGRSSRPAREPATTVNKSDQELFNQFSKKYKEITGFESQPPLREPAGALFEYGYYQYGIPSLATPGWSMDIPKDTTLKEDRQGRQTSGRQSSARGAFSMRGASGMTGAGGSSGGGDGMDATALKWLKKNNSDGFVEWQSVSHPDFDDVEVGGFDPMAVTNPPADMISDLGEKHGEFMVYLSSLYADVKIAQTEVTSHGGGIFRIKAEIENAGFLPTAIQHGVTSRGVKPTMVQLGVDPDAIMSGSRKTNFIQKLDGSGKRQKYEWLIKGRSGDKIELKVVSQKGGSDSATIVLK